MIPRNDFSPGKESYLSRLRNKRILLHLSHSSSCILGNCLPGFCIWNYLMKYCYLHSIQYIAIAICTIRIIVTTLLIIEYNFTFYIISYDNKMYSGNMIFHHNSKHPKIELNQILGHLNTFFRYINEKTLVPLLLPTPPFYLCKRNIIL